MISCSARFQMARGQCQRPLTDTAGPQLPLRPALGEVMPSKLKQQAIIILALHLAPLQKIKMIYF